MLLYIATAFTSDEQLRR